MTRNRVVAFLKAAPTYLTALALAVTAGAQYLAQEAPAGWEPVVAIAPSVAAWLTFVALMIRQVTTVPEGMRGLSVPADTQRSVWHDDQGGTYTYVRGGSSGASFTQTASNVVMDFKPSPGGEEPKPEEVEARGHEVGHAFLDAIAERSRRVRRGLT